MQNMSGPENEMDGYSNPPHKPQKRPFEIPPEGRRPSIPERRIPKIKATRRPDLGNSVMRVDLYDN